MSKQRKRKYLQIVVTFLCICMLGGFSGKQVHAETGYALIPKVKEAQTGWFVKYWSGWKYIYANGKCPKTNGKRSTIRFTILIKTVICRPAGRKYKIPGTIFARAARTKGHSAPDGKRSPGNGISWQKRQVQE